MNATLSPIAPDTCHARLAARALELGVLLWRCDASGNITDAPGAPEALLGWYAQAEVQQRVGEIAALRRTTQPTDGLEFLPGFRAFVLDERVAGHVTALYVGVVPEAVGAADADPQALQECRTQRGNLSIAKLRTILRWSLDEQSRQARDDKTIEQFSDKLAQAYEEVNLLFRLARLLNCQTRPAQVIEMLCSQVQQVLPFQWVGVQFHPRNTVIQELSGKFIMAGESPLKKSGLQTLATSLLNCWQVDHWTTVLTPSNHELARQTGAEVIAEPITHDNVVVGALIAGNKTGSDLDVSSDEMQFLDAAADFLGIFHENISRFEEQKSLFLSTVQVLTAAIDAKDAYTCGHSERVALLASQMAAAMEMKESEVETYRIAGLVHDVGKIGVPEAVLCKTGRLTEAEFAQMKLHPEIGHRILRGVPLLGPTLPGVLHHHERWDGRGYPHGLAGANIPLIGRMLALADTFDAMSSNRAYRSAMPRETVLAEIRRCAGSQFDPALVPTFLGLDFSAYDKTVARHAGVAELVA